MNASTCAVLALAAGGVSVTITKSKMFHTFREWAWRNWRWFGQLVYCPYCTAHWLVFAGMALYRPRLVNCGVPVVDVLVTTLVVITVATFVAALLVRAYHGMFADYLPPQDSEED